MIRRSRSSGSCRFVWVVLVIVLVLLVVVLVVLVVAFFVSVVASHYH